MEGRKGKIVNLGRGRVFIEKSRTEYTQSARLLVILNPAHRYFTFSFFPCQYSQSTLVSVSFVFSMSLKYFKILATICQTRFNTVLKLRASKIIAPFGLNFDEHL